MLKSTTQCKIANTCRRLLLAFLCLSLSACNVPFIHNANGRGSSNSKQLKVAITTHLGDQAHFIKGDEIQFLLSLNQNSYALLLYRDASNRLWQLFPNRMRDTQKLPAGDYMNFPLAEDGIRITVGPPYGEEQVVLYASNKPFPKLAFSQSSNGLRQLKSNMSDVESAIRKHGARLHADIALAKNTIATSEH